MSVSVFTCVRERVNEALVSETVPHIAIHGHLQKTGDPLMHVPFVPDDALRDLVVVDHVHISGSK